MNSLILSLSPPPETRFGPNSNNEGRYHNLEQAREADRRGRCIYQDIHTAVVVVENGDKGIDGKLARVLDWFERRS